MTEQNLKELFGLIAKDELGIDTLEQTRSGQDFHEVAVWTVEAALRRAFELGATLGSVVRPTLPNKRKAMSYLLRRSTGATIDELCKATGWIEASVRRELARLYHVRGMTRALTTQIDGQLRYRLP